MGGDLDLSITMTMLSCVLALGLTPAWLQVVPYMVDSDDEITIPFAEIGTTLAAVIVPAFIGSFINWLGQVNIPCFMKDSFLLKHLNPFREPTSCPFKLGKMTERSQT
jgi:predicted Na+-dependent transporter